MLSPFIHNNITYVVVVGRGGTRDPNTFNKDYQLENNESSEWVVVNIYLRACNAYMYFLPSDNTYSSYYYDTTEFPIL